MSRSRSPEKRSANDPGGKFKADSSSLRDSSISRTIAERPSGRETSNQSRNLNPQTPPQRFVSSTYSSPGSILGKEEEAIIIEIHPRYLQAGLEGESHPQCKLHFNPDSFRRIGDYRVWLPDFKRTQESLDTWAEDYELWRNNVEGIDQDLLSDKLERVVREAYNKHLLVDAGLARLVLVIPSLVPHPVLETILSTLFERWRFPSITLLPSPTMSVMAAGMRSALVVEIGWEETVVTCVYDFREVANHRSARGTRLLTSKFASALKDVVEKRPDSKELRFDLEFVEDLLGRILPGVDLTKPGESNVKVQGVSTDGDGQNSIVPSHEIEIEWSSSTTTEHIRIPREMIRSAVEDVFLNDGGDPYPDDDETTVSKLIFKALLALSQDLRSACMSRIIFTGDIAGTPGLKDKILREVQSLIADSEWSSIKGRHFSLKRSELSALAQNRASVADAKHDIPAESIKDYVEERLRKSKAKHAPPPGPDAEIREVTSLGAWSGASLLSSLKIRGFVEIERERFLSHGIAGAGRDVEISVVPPPQRMSSFGIPKSNKTQDRTSWTLAGWG